MDNYTIDEKLNYVLNDYIEYGNIIKFGSKAQLNYDFIKKQPLLKEQFYQKSYFLKTQNYKLGEKKSALHVDGYFSLKKGIEKRTEFYRQFYGPLKIFLW